MKTALITGIGHGIGRALTDTFLEKGFFVIGTSLTGTVDFQHENLFVCRLDLSSPASIEECERTVQGLDKKIDIFINNAGVLLDEDETALVPDKLRATLEVNLIGTADLTERLLTSMDPSGHVIFISSSAGSIDYAEKLLSHHPLHYPAYKISKTALNMYMCTLAVRLKHDGSTLTVSSVNPGWVKTEIGGPGADLTPEQAADDIYKFAITSPETGYFWFKGEKLPW